MNARNGTISAALLACGLVLSVATQLRLVGLSFGLGELLLLMWLIYTWVRVQPGSISQERYLLTAFVLIGSISLALGWLFSAYPEGVMRPAPAHDALAYLFCAVLTFAYVLRRSALVERIPEYYLLFFLLSIPTALLLGSAMSEWSGLDVLYGTERWRHLSVNPNQFALMVLPVPFFSLFLVLKGSGNLIWPTSIGLVALLFGYLSQSDALLMAWLIGGLIAGMSFAGHVGPGRRLFAGLLIVLMVASSAWYLLSKMNLLAPVATAPVATAPVATAPVATAPVATAPVATAPVACTHAMEVQGEAQQLNVRLCLWKNALVALSHSPFFGLGPGAHSGITAPFRGEEAHNTLLDLATQAGLVGALAAFVCALFIMLLLARSRRYELLALFVALLCFATFHHILRQPLFWLLPLITLKLASAWSPTFGSHVRPDRLPLPRRL